MTYAKRVVWSCMVQSIRVYQRLFMRLHVWGRENIPPGPKLFLTNHITSHDSFWVLPIFREPLHIVIGPGYTSPRVGRVLDWLEQINATPEHRSTVVPQAVEWLRRGESVYMAPEGVSQELFHLGRFYPGAARIYLQARVPVVPVALVAPKWAMSELPFQEEMGGQVFRTRTVLRGPFCINVGAPMQPTPVEAGSKEQEEQISAAFRTRMAELVEDVRVNKFWLTESFRPAKRS